MNTETFRVECAPTLLSLWPKTKDENPMQKQMWVVAAGPYSAEQVNKALRDMYLDGHRFGPTPADLKKKLTALFAGQVQADGQARGTTHTNTREREICDQRQHKVWQIINGLPDEDLAGHALMHAAGLPGLVWTLRLDPRADRWMRNVIVLRIEAGLKPTDESRLVWGKDGQPGLMRLDPQLLAWAREYQQVVAACRAQKRPILSVEEARQMLYPTDQGRPVGTNPGRGISPAELEKLRQAQERMPSYRSPRGQDPQPLGFADMAIAGSQPSGMRAQASGSGVHPTTLIA